jgi:acetoacetate decarboxylase
MTRDKILNAPSMPVFAPSYGEARLHFIPHINCRVADLPVKRLIGGRHMIVDFVLPYGRVLHDYLA